MPKSYADQLEERLGEKDFNAMSKSVDTPAFLGGLICWLRERGDLNDDELYAEFLPRVAAAKEYTFKMLFDILDIQAAENSKDAERFVKLTQAFLYGSLQPNRFFPKSKEDVEKSKKIYDDFMKDVEEEAKCLKLGSIEK